MRYLLLVMLSVVASLACAQDFSAAGPNSHEVVDGSWIDAARNGREVLYRAYVPSDLKAAAPVVIFSHGLGGNREGYSYFGQFIASHGYISVHLQHPGSDTEIIRQAIAEGGRPLDAMRKSAANPKNAIDRPKDVTLAINNLQGTFAGKASLEQIAVAGHSFGGYTTMAIAGQGNSVFKDKRVNAAIAMSAPAPKLAGGYEAIDIPVLVMTGTLDDSPLLGGTAKSRVDAFGQLTTPDRYLLVFTGGDHMIFSGSPDAFRRATLGLPGMAGDRSKDPMFQKHINALSLAFLNAYLKGDDHALNFLTSDKATQSLKDIATFQYAPANK